MHSLVLIILAITIESLGMSLLVPYIDLTVSHSSVLIILAITIER